MNRGVNPFFLAYGQPLILYGGSLISERLFRLADQAGILDDEDVQKLLAASEITATDVVQDVASKAVLRKALEQTRYPFKSTHTTTGIQLGESFQGKPYRISEEDLTRHFLAVGQSGSGKTTLLYNLYKEVEKPVWFFDLKQDYRHLIQENSELLVLPWTQFKHNPLKPPKGVPPRRWAQVFAEIFGHATALLSGSKNYLMKKIIELYQLYNLFNEVSEPFPGLHELELLIKQEGINYVRKQSNYRDTLLNRLEAMNLVAGTVFDCSEGYSVTELLNRDVVFEFDGLSRDVQNFLMEILFATVYEYRLAENQRNRVLNHLFFLDEGKRVFSVYKERQDAAGIPEIDELTAKMREFGEGLVVGDQEASKLTDSIKANTYTKALLPTTGKQFQAVADSMNLTPQQKQFAEKLGTGEAVIQTGNHEPVPVQINEFELSKDVGDRELRKSQQAKWDQLIFERRKSTDLFKKKLAGDNPLQQKLVPDDPSEIQLSKNAVRLLEDVLDSPFKPLTDRYERFSSSYKGNKAKTELVDQGVVIERNVRNGSKRKLLQLTEKGRNHAEESLDLDTKQRGRGGIIHRYWQHQIKQRFEEAGWHAFIEKFDADVYINMDEIELAVEVAMGNNPREIQHIKKHLNRDFQIWIICRNHEIMDGLKQSMEDKEVETDQVSFWLFRRMITSK